ncbi:hypothetical protein TRICI_005924 [Trichomonascus ciferrii]|uniref:tRNA/rRNA methyltransferase SpoU type domain-containing protein n=1 Tax=Trichomonascus ciferrii TaxID=44093 RepID=A0A642UN07_9ASCO|nr:hypothetical protein TRICI_005924 [Trichomonascus ciferrii]
MCSASQKSLRPKSSAKRNHGGLGAGPQENRSVKVNWFEDLAGLEEQMSLSVVAGQIDASIKHEWALDLSRKVLEPGNGLELSEALVDLWKSKGEEDWSVDTSKVLSFLCERIVELLRFVLDYTCEIIDRQLVPSNLIRELRPFVDKQDKPNEEAEQLRVCFGVIYLVFLDPEQVRCIFRPFQEQVCILQGSKDFALSKAAEKVFGLLVGETEFTNSNPDLIWKTVQALLSADYGHYWDLGYRLWVRWTSKLKLSNNENFQGLLASEEYWKMLQKGINASSNDHKKYCLTVLKRSIQQTTVDIDSDNMRWEVKRSDEYVSEWQRFTTLLEIISIDTSLHQTEDSASDLRYMMSTKSVIPPVWTTCLLSAGLGSSMESIRRFVAKVLLSMPTEDLVLFEYQPDFLCQVFFPHVMMASYFMLEHKNDGGYYCPHAESLCEFASELFRTLSDERCTAHLTCLLEFYTEEKYTFDPARIYLLRGVELGLSGRYVVSQKNVELLAGLTTNITETKVRAQHMFVMFISLLNCTEANILFSELWFRALNGFFKNNVDFLHLVWDQTARTIKSHTDGESKLLNTAELDTPFKAELYCRVASEENGVGFVRNLSLEDTCKAVNLGLPACTKVINTEEVYSRVCAMIESDITQFSGQLSETVYRAAQRLKVKPSVDLKVGAVFTKQDYKSINSMLRTINLSNVRDDLSLSEVWPIFESRYRGKSDLETRAEREGSIAKVYELLSGKNLKDADADYANILETASDHFSSAAAPCRYAICRFLNKLMPQLQELPSNTALILETLWNGMIDERLMANERYLHHEYIELAFSSKIVEDAREDEHLREVLENLAESLISQSYARRGILPKLAECLYKNRPQEWIVRVFAAIYTFQQLDNNVFKLETIMADYLDSRLTDEGIVADTYYTSYGIPERSSKAIAAAYLSSLSKGHEELFDHIMGSEKYSVIAAVKRNDEREERVRIRAYQILLMLQPHLTADKMATALHEWLLPAVDSETSPSVRVYVEWISCRILMQMFDEVEEDVLLPLEKSEDQPRILASFQRMALILARNLRKTESVEVASDFYRAFLLRVIPLATSNRAAVRHSAVMMLYAVHVELSSSECSDEFKAYLSDLVSTVRNIAHNAEAVESFKYFRSGDQTLWDLENDYTLVGICGGVVARVYDHYYAMLKPWELRKYVPDVESLLIPVGKMDSVIWTVPVSKTVEKAFTAGTSTQLQTKSGAWNIESDIDNNERQIKRGELIVLASLVDKAPNLGGICRLSDVLGAQLLCLNDLTVARNPQFKTVAVTADQWMPMKEVKADEIIPFMKHMKQNGYTLIGLEQTDKSVELNRDLEFPRKSLLLLGREKEGIPGDLLAELDFCVEIKQVGMIRSMNIQTATAVVVQAYSSQHC